ncbi:MAG: cytochrome c [Gammaproteobacteria bacterium]|nr:MAG: cytochrome c [Gammaproteobacteria bacterium]
MLLAISVIAVADAGEVPAGNDAHESGRAIYNYRCYFCHGYSGDAKTLTSTYLAPPPRDFTRSDPHMLKREDMIDTVKNGRPGTAMHGFARLLNDREIVQVVDFVRLEFMLEKRPNTRYHTDANGWPEHERYRHAFPFATGSIPLDTPWQALSPSQVRGKQLYLTSCITCHDRARVNDEGAAWSKQSVSYPRNNYSHTEIDAVSSASIYVKHDVAPSVDDLSVQAREGKALWQQNCAFCHAADGTGENWIGSFLEPKPRDLTDAAFMRSMTRYLLRQRIREGLANTSMPAWKNVLDDEQIDQIISYIDEAFFTLGSE